MYASAMMLVATMNSLSVMLFFLLISIFVRVVILGVQHAIMQATQSYSQLQRCN